MKRVTHGTLLALFLIAAGTALPLASQDKGAPKGPFIAAAFMETLSLKPAATWGDAVVFTVMITGGTPKNFTADLAALNAQGYTAGITAKEDDPLNRGDAALVIARVLKLDDSFMYTLFGGRRYAVVACKAAGIINGTAGTDTPVSGGELIDIMSAAAAALEKNQGQGGSQK